MHGGSRTEALRDTGIIPQNAQQNGGNAGARESTQQLIFLRPPYGYLHSLELREPRDGIGILRVGEGLETDESKS